MGVVAFIVTICIVALIGGLSRRRSPCDDMLEDARRRRLKPTDYGTSYHKNLNRWGVSSSLPPLSSSSGYDSPAWGLIEMRRMREHQEKMTQLSLQNQQLDTLRRTLQSSGPVPGGPTDRLWKGEW